MAGWTTTQVADRLELAADVFAAARCQAAGLLQLLARVLPQLRRLGRPGAADASAPAHSSRYH